ncbi:MAG TPA: hypothetical protein VMY42_24090 [Thermoguttaceae bacterium]|nr:hypothetical protein [Thermoguttaceae bacterium]
MKWLELTIPPAVSVFVGGMIPIVLFYLKEWLDSRKRISEWFEKKYIEDAIDSLHQFFGEWAILSSLPAKSVQELVANPVFNRVPSQAAATLATITGGVSFQNWFNAMRGQWLRAANQRDWNQLVKFHTHAASMVEHLNVLRRELLGHRIRAKTDAYSLRDLKCVADFNDSLQRMTDDLVADPHVTTYTPRQGETEERPS